MANPTILAATLVSQIRTDSDLNQSQVYTDSGICGLLSDAGSDLLDLFTQTNQHYTISTFDFTLSGGLGDTPGVNSIDLSVTPGDFQQGHSVDVNPGTAQPYTLKYLSNWLDRNRGTSAASIFGPANSPKEYFFLGSKLIVLPQVNAAGSFRLYYTPMWVPLVLPQPAPGPTPVLTSFEFGAGGGLVSFTGTAFTSANVGDTMISTGDANSANNFVAAITSVASATVVQVDTPLATEGSPAAAITIQPQGTRPDLPPLMNPWILYLKTIACITIRNKRGQDVDAFERRLVTQRARIETILQERQEEPTQPPLTRGGGGFFGGGDW